MPNYKFALQTASLLLVLVFTFSCSDDEVSQPDFCWSDTDKSFISCEDGSENYGGGIINGESTESFTISEITNESFSYTEDYYECMEGGVLQKETRTYEVPYLIKDNILEWLASDTLNFTGKTKGLTGVWTRTKNASCTEDSSDYWNCNIVKAQFTESTLKLTHNHCSTDIFTDESVDDNGIKLKIINCNTYELSKDSYKVKTKSLVTKYGISWETTFKGKTCKYNDMSNSYSAEKKNACKDAWETCSQHDNWELYYYDFLLNNWSECLNDIFKL
ncbi:MAG: hypothetical protein LBH25_13805 [Fibromonadaceae bacterium]|nr:hypothetical protein [Fibromonadaceae bacterium]